jgi:hypothetical protein
MMTSAVRTVFDPAAREELWARMQRVTADSRPTWGKMNAPQMVAHLIAALQMGLGELEVAPKRSPLAHRFMRWLVIYKLPFPRGTPTAPELVAPPSGDWQAALGRFHELLERTGTRAPADDWPRHPVFGAMPGTQWGNLSYRHIDHHLRQFGV